MAVKSNVTTPLRKETYKNLQLNAGVTLVDFDITDYANADALKTALDAAIADGSKLLGATRGGGSFTITRDIRQVEADGVRTSFVGSEIVDSADAYLSETLIEQTPEHLQAVLGNADIDDEDEEHIVMKIRLAIDETDYLTNVIWIGDTSEGFVAIELYNGLNTADFNFTWADKNEGTVTAEFHAHQDDVNGDGYIPVRIHFLYPADTSGSEVVSGGNT